ncbi:Alkanesulfonate monooxygenase [Ruegeria sp. THAF57]|uniref:LLM class oxidoreductase n=1 Tax=Ruegeria sp. THAF57 TaxID=2744555 RepID=UPI0015DDBCD7|nr:LLM class oxidoreductase [Ruegeria sp. THAF57]CAD0187197.1 Alkanesulfonate monooxygenase [Ruegeria sp. THAF57]
MLKQPDPAFDPINAGFDAVFAPGRLTLGLVAPIETYAHGPVPTLDDHAARIQLAEQLGFAAVWLRDVPFTVPSFGDAGQVFDPFVYLGYLAAQTNRIALGVASIILPLRHPAHVAKAAASVDQLSGGRLVLGIASGDRPEEYPALNQPFAQRSEGFRDSYDYIRAMAQPHPQFHNARGSVTAGMDMLPKPVGTRLPLLTTGLSQQSPDWFAQHSDGWITFPRPAPQQARLIAQYREAIAAHGGRDKPVMEPLYVDLAADPDTPPRPIHLGLHLGLNALRAYLRTRQQIGVNHIALNLRFNGADIPDTLTRLADTLLPEFSA